MTRIPALALAFLAALPLVPTGLMQTERPTRDQRARHKPAGPEQALRGNRQKLLDRFDKNGDGVLSPDERRHPRRARARRRRLRGKGSGEKRDDTEKRKRPDRKVRKARTDRKSRRRRRHDRREDG
ncbi:MAG: hypothetical protein CMJ83_11810 [Planctomycetes bacterium]|nr:hypothetical protein [Planctomycetota bacterium]